MKGQRRSGRDALALHNGPRCALGGEVQGADMHDVFPDVEPHPRVEQVRLPTSCVTCGWGCGCGLRRWGGPGLGHLGVHIEDVVELVVLNCIGPCPVV